jgi:hypothetical protein
MANYVENRISFYGNKAVDALTAEVNKRLKAHDDIATVLYGTSFVDDEEALKRMGSDYIIEAKNEFGDSSEICLQSSNNAPEQLENHLIWFYSKMDPAVVLCNYYAHFRGGFFGVRYKFVSRSRIKTLEEYREVSKIVVSESEIENLEEEEKNDYMSWEEHCTLHMDLNELVKERLITSYPDKARNFGL